MKKGTVKVPPKSIPPKHISPINLIPHIIQARIIPVGNNRITLLLKRHQIIHHSAPKKRRTILKRWLINHHTGTLSLNTLHHTMNRTHHTLRHIIIIHQQLLHFLQKDLHPYKIQSYHVTTKSTI